MVRTIPALILAVMVALGAGCLQGGGKCSDNGDCVASRVCIQGHCANAPDLQGSSSGAPGYTSSPGASTAQSVSHASSRATSSSSVTYASSVSYLSTSSAASAVGEQSSSATLTSSSIPNWDSSSAAPSFTHATQNSSSGPPPACGNGLVEAGEGCDDNNGVDRDGCDAHCQQEAQWDCPAHGGRCALCGDGLVQPPEDCDDGNRLDGDGCNAGCVLESDYICVGEPSVCQSCGNGVVEGSEQCDGPGTAALGCLALGSLPLSAVECSQCRVTPGSCGALISSVGGIQAAINLAGTFAPPRRIRIPALPTGYSLETAGTITVSSAVTLEPLNGPVVFTSSRTEPVFTVTAPGCTFHGLTFHEVARAIQGSWGTGGAVPVTTLAGMKFENRQTNTWSLIALTGSNIHLVGNFFSSTANARSMALVDLGNAGGQKVLMNVFTGSFRDVVSMGGGLLDHNSVLITNPDNGSTVFTLTGGQACMRNNVVETSRGAPGSFTTWQLNNVQVGQQCPMDGAVGAASNHVPWVGRACAGTACSLCPGAAGSGPLCDLTATVEFAAGVAPCLPPDSPLRNTAYNLEYDLDDNSDSLWAGAGPDVGALEGGTARSFGGVPVDCP